VSLRALERPGSETSNDRDRFLGSAYEAYEGLCSVYCSPTSPSLRRWILIDNSLICQAKFAHRITEVTNKISTRNALLKSMSVISSPQHTPSLPHHQFLPGSLISMDDRSEASKKEMDHARHEDYKQATSTCVLSCFTT
jgi:hypothetical protein